MLLPRAKASGASDIINMVKTTLFTIKNMMQLGTLCLQMNCLSVGKGVFIFYDYSALVQLPLALVFIIRVHQV